MTETPRDPFAPDPAPNPVPPPIEPTPVQPTPVEPTPVEPAPVEPAPAEPAPVEPAEPAPAPPVEPAPEPLSPPEPPEPITPPEPAAPPAPAEVPPPAEVPVEAPPLEVPAPVETPVEAPAPVQPAVPVAVPAPEQPVAAAPVEPVPAPAVDPGYPLPVPAPVADSAPADVDPVADAPTRPRRAWLPATAVALAVLLIAGAAGWLGWQVRQQSVAEDGRPDAIAAARDAARLLFSYDHASLEEDFAKGLAVTTGEFRSEYSRTTKEVVTPVAQQYKAVVVAEVVEASIVEDGPGRATALVFLNQGTTSTRVQGQQVDQSRVRMQLVEVDGRWLVRAVDAL